MKVATIGFTKKSAEQFFGLLKDAGIQTVVDIRLHNNSQLAGFAKGRDLPFFLRELVDAEYVHVPELAPTPELLERYREDKDWQVYEQDFVRMLDEAEPQAALGKLVEFAQPICLLCSEDKPGECHRRLVAERFRAMEPSAKVLHLR